MVVTDADLRSVIAFADRRDPTSAECLRKVVEKGEHSAASWGGCMSPGLLFVATLQAPPTADIGCLNREVSALPKAEAATVQRELLRLVTRSIDPSSTVLATTKRIAVACTPTSASTSSTTVVTTK